MGRGFLSLTAPAGLRVVEGAFKNKGAPEHEMNYSSALWSHIQGTRGKGF